MTANICLGCYSAIMDRSEFGQLQQRIKDLLINSPADASIVATSGDDTVFLKTGESAGSNVVYEVASITKVFTSLLLVLLELDGVVDRKQAISQIWDIEFSDSKVGAITLEELALHTSGLPRLPHGFTPKDPSRPYRDFKEADLKSFLTSHTLDSEQKGKVEYSNIGYGLLGHLLAIASGTNYQTLLASYITDPLSMSDTHVNLPESQLKTVQGFASNNKPTPNLHQTGKCHL